MSLYPTVPTLNSPIVVGHNDYNEAHNDSHDEN